MNLSAVQPNKQQHVIGDQPKTGPHLPREEVRCSQDLLRSDEFFQRGLFAPFWGRTGPVPMHDVADGLVTDPAAEIPKGLFVDFECLLPFVLANPEKQLGSARFGERGLERS